VSLVTNGFDEKEMKELFFGIIIVVVGMFPTLIRTICSDGQWKGWNRSRRD
jgi:hypothetical protein